MSPLPRALRIILVALIAVAIGACGAQTPAPSGSPVLGTVRVSVERAAGVEGFFASEHHARLVDPDGRVVLDWKLSEGDAFPAEAPVGSYTLSAFTVFLSDFLQCTPDPVRPGLETCFTPTLGPAQVCSVAIEVTAPHLVDARFSVLREGLCSLELIPQPVPLRTD